MTGSCRSGSGPSHNPQDSRPFQSINGTPGDPSACILCGRIPDCAAISEGGYKSFRCRTCGIIFIAPRPSAKQVADLYSNDAAHLSAATQILPSHASALHARLMLRILGRFRRIGRLAEVGAGGGQFLGRAASLGYQVVGVETNPILRNHIRSLGIPCDGVLRGSFDIVYARDVLSHFRDPVLEMRRIHAALVQDGLLVLESGNIGDVDETYLDRFPTFQYPDHLFFFGEASLRELLRRTGFRVLEVRRYNILPSLWLRRTESRLRHRLKALLVDTPSQAPKPPVDGYAGPGHRTRRLVKDDVVEVLSHAFTYGVGRVLPRSRRPQTLIIVAQRIG